MSFIHDEIEAAKTVINNLFSKLKSSTILHNVEEEGEALIQSGWNYIKTNGLMAAYTICVSVVKGAATGTPWATLCATAVEQIEQAGITIFKGAETIMMAQAQADLIAAGKIIAPSTGETVSLPPVV